MVPAKTSITASDLKRDGFFEGFSEKEIAEFLKACTVQSFGPDERVVQENDTSRDLFIILSGEVRIEKVLYAGDEKELGVLGQGEFFGEMAFLDGSPRSASAACVEESVILSMSRSSFEKLAARRPGIAYKVTMKIAGALAERLRTSNNMIESFFSNPNKAILELKTRLIRIQAMLGR